MATSRKSQKQSVGRPSTPTGGSAKPVVGEADTSDDWAGRVGASIRALRQDLSLTLVDLAGKTGLSHSFLSQIERGRAHPSMQSLYEIAQALGTSQDRLIGRSNPTEDDSPIVLQRADAGVRISSDAVELASSAVARRELITQPGSFHPIEFTGLGTSFGDEWFRHSGIEFVYMATGSIEVELGDGTLYTLRPGDSLRYPGRIPHRWRAKGRARMRALMVHTGAHPDADPPASR